MLSPPFQIQDATRSNRYQAPELYPGMVHQFLVTFRSPLLYPPNTISLRGKRMMWIGSGRTDVGEVYTRWILGTMECHTSDVNDLSCITNRLS